MTRARRARSGRALVIAGRTREMARASVESRGYTATAVVDWRDLVKSPLGVRRLARQQSIDVVAVHSHDWARQRMPQLYELALALLPARHRVIADDQSAELRVLTRRRLAGRVALAPFEVAAGLGDSAAEAVRFLCPAGHTFRRTLHDPTILTGRSRSSGPAVLAIWPGAEGAVGGSVTHISGILDGFRRRGLRVGLVTTVPLPEQLKAVVDDYEVTAPLPAGARIDKIPEALAVNRAVRTAVSQIAPRLTPAFVYQRHRWFHVAGLDTAQSLHVPLVLEWNASAAWQFVNWATRPPGARATDALLHAMERRVAREADLIAAVSDRAADMALAAGAVRDRVFVSPNGVNFEAVRRIADEIHPEPHTRELVLGWSGSFGHWHGTDVLISALPHLPLDVRAVLVGDGPEQGRCRELAERLGVLGRITWTGMRTWADAIRQLAACDVLVTPHVPLAGQPFFGSPTKLFEYMAIGKPIVASRLEQIGEVLTDGHTALLVEPGDPVALAAAVTRVRDLPDRGAAIGRAALAEAQARHTWEIRASEILAHLAQLPLTATISAAHS